MKWANVAQGSPEWIEARLGIPTASCFDRILTPKKLAASASQRAYTCELLAERVLRMPVVGAGSLWMERGSALEKEARAYYELTADVEAKPCGLALTDDGRAGASPDSTVGDDGLLELKCPAAHTHLYYLLFGLGDDYRLQLQGQLWVAERAWVDFLSYCPGFPPVLIRTEREPEVLDALAIEVPKFCAALDYAQGSLDAMTATKQEAIA